MMLGKFKPRQKRDRSDEFASFEPQARTAAKSGTRTFAEVFAEVAPRQAAPILKTGPDCTKRQTYRSESWRRAVASLPCMLCGREGMTQAAHINRGKGMALKTHDCWTAALCAPCHAELDQGSQHTKAERRAILDTACLLTLARLAQEGLVRPA